MNPPNPLQALLQHFRQSAANPRDLGDRFERLIVAYLKTDPLHADRFSDVWLFNDWPQKGSVGDVGIDIVAREAATGDFCGIQCKFYLPEHTISKVDIDSFISALGRPLYTSGIVVSTTDRWGSNAEHALGNQTKTITRITLRDLEQSPVDWSSFSFERPDRLARSARNSPLPHQATARADVLKGFDSADRGKLIMACGTGKTFTALCIAEALAPQGNILFLVPSLSLLSQALREWTAQASHPIHAIAVCSDPKIGKRTVKAQNDDRADIGVHDLAFPATTQAPRILAQHHALKTHSEKSGGRPQMTVIFATYQSIEAVSECQRLGFPAFDLVICDEAHRTTGVTLSGDEDSHFVRVHDNDFLKARKRLYMTATPRIYGDDAKSKAKEADAELCSMDDPNIFGPEFHRLGFGEAVGKSLLSDYKVLVLAVDQGHVSREFQAQLADHNNELKLDDAVKIVGCWNGLEKRFLRPPVPVPSSANADEPADASPASSGPMRRAVAFSASIKDSRKFVAQFASIIQAHRARHPDLPFVQCEIDHVDGTFDSLRRNHLLDWLKADAPDNTCRILSNARCLSEGVDVPALDAVLFLNPRNSVVDVVQSVGRVMRRAPGKQYGYIILPIGIPTDIPPEEALKDHDKYKVVWQVLQALRAHDDRFNAIINQIELNKERPDRIDVIGIGATGHPDDTTAGDGTRDPQRARDAHPEFAFPKLGEWKDAIYARVVLKCGDRRYWETWAGDVAVIAERHADRLKAILAANNPAHRAAFDAFLSGLRTNINPSISEADAIEMLSQHLITRPVFDALFDNQLFSRHNPVSVAMQQMLDALEDQALEKETARLASFYQSVRQRAAGIDNPEGRQRVIVELYDKFFRTAFPKMAERLGIVYTPIEVVDFILHSVEDVLQHEFQSSLSHHDVHVIDPFTGTGTFVTRLLQSGLIQPKDLPHKYLHEIHANEIVLLAYYIAAINIEETYHALLQPKASYAPNPQTPPYQPFQGIVLTDTFQLHEPKSDWDQRYFPENNRRVQRQKNAPIRVVIGNPPYSAQQESENDNNKGLDYPALDARIEQTFAKRSRAANKKNNYDSYARAIRWASDRIQGRGIVAFVTNGSFIDGNAMDGIRACLADEFNTLYVFNLRGNQRTSGETSRMEGGKIFGAGSRAAIAISLMVKNPDKTKPATILYHDIGDYLDREAKLGILRSLRSLNALHRERKWQVIVPNESSDWINQRDPAFERFPVLGDKKNPEALRVFGIYSQGLLTSRDRWCYDFSSKALARTTSRLIDFYNEQVAHLQAALKRQPTHDKMALAEAIISTDPTKISWSSSLKDDLVRGRVGTQSTDRIIPSSYRPFTKMWVYADDLLIHRLAQLPQLFPTAKHPNLVIATTGIGTSRDFSALISDSIPNYHLHDTAQCFPLYEYQPSHGPKHDASLNLLSSEDGETIIDGYRRTSGITREILGVFRGVYGKEVGREDIFYYVYGVLHSPEYRRRFASDLKKMLPRLPLTREAGDFWKFSKAGRELAQWHVNYETCEPWPLSEVSTGFLLDPSKDYLVEKMTYARPTAEQKARGEKWDRTSIVYNSRITLTGIPAEAHDYIVNGKPALDWILERYQVTVDKDSGIRNDPNDWCREHNAPRYILDLLKRIVRVSIETMKIVNSLPALNERTST